MSKKPVTDLTTPTEYVVDFAKLSEGDDISLKELFKQKSVKPGEVIDKLWNLFVEKKLLQAK